MGVFIRLLFAVSLAAALSCRSHAGGFSFAVISDLHIGEGADDFGTPGYDDALAGRKDSGSRRRNLAKAIAKVNALAAPEGIQFVFATGDLTHSAERSQFLAARELLDSLIVPYVPVLGNHDVWPYTRRTQAPAPMGDEFFEAVFHDALADLQARFPDFRKPEGAVWNPEHGCVSRFQNFAFSFAGYGFIALDWNSRGHAFPRAFHGSLPEADLHNFTGGTYPWLAQLVRSGWIDGKKRVFVFQHHPFHTLVPDWAFSFNRSEKRKVAQWLRREEFWGVFAGHQHRNYIGHAFDRLDRLPRPFEPGPSGPAWAELVIMASVGPMALRDALAPRPGQEPFYQVETAACKTRAAVTVVRVAGDGRVTVSQR